MGRGLGSLQLLSCNKGGRKKAAGHRGNMGMVHGHGSHLARSFKSDGRKSLSKEGKLIIIIQWRECTGVDVTMMYSSVPGVVCQQGRFSSTTQVDVTRQGYTPNLHIAIQILDNIFYQSMC